MIKIIQPGDLFKVQGNIGHGANCAGAMGAGIAIEFRRRWPDMYEKYRELCKIGSFIPGTIFPWKDESEGRWIYNLGTQAHWKTGATLDYIKSSIEEMIKHMRSQGETCVSIPRIGAGLGGLIWADVLEVLESIDTTGIMIQVIIP